MISLLVIGLFMLLLTRMAQEITIVIDMFSSWPNLLLTILLINFLALILSHFPYYFDLALRDENREIEWIKDYNLGLFGFVYHNTSFNPRDNILIKILRRHIGIVMYSIWFLVLLMVRSEVFDKDIDVSSWFVIWNLVFLLIHISVQAHQNHIKSSIRNEEIHDDSKTKSHKAVRNYLILFQSVLFFNIILCIYFLIKVSQNGWSEANLNLLILLTFFNALLYLLFRMTRSWFVYFRRGEGKALDVNKYYRQELGSQFTVFEMLPLRFLASTPNYLAAMGFFGVLFTFPVITIGTLTSHSIQCLNPIPLLIIIVAFYYSAIVITLKHFIYYKSNSYKIGDTFNIWMSRVIMALPFLFGLLIFSMNSIDNDLHTLPFVNAEISNDQTNPEMTKQEFISGIDTTLDKHYFIGSYGGGLKANIWNLFLFNELTALDDDFLESTICISGVSGGSIGLANFTALKNNYEGHNYELNDVKISEIGEANMLSTDLFGWLFKDFWREALPGTLFSFNGKDRANLSMEIYSEMIHKSNYALQVPMRQYWRNTYDKHGYFPAIIFNTTPTTSSYGVACSVKGMSFPISIDILEFEKDENGDFQSISFFGAASTTNRFPLFSPTARISGKGHFVDGGYFENSGLLYAKRFYDEIKQDTTLKFKRVSAINIINDKGLFIMEKLKSYGITDFSGPEKHEGEIISILNGIVALERFPRYMRELISEEKNLDLITLQMPYYFDLDDIKKVYQVEFFTEEDIAKLNPIIAENNLAIEKALRSHKDKNLQPIYDFENWGLVEPPLGRLMSKPAVEYQRAMVKYHPDVRRVIDLIVSR
jgi:hypothetical protein